MLTEYSEGARYLIMVLYVFAVCLNCIFFFSIYSFKLEYYIRNTISLWLLSMLLAIPSSCIVCYLLFKLIAYIFEIFF